MILSWLMHSLILLDFFLNCGLNSGILLRHSFGSIWSWDVVSGVVYRLSSIVLLWLVKWLSSVWVSWLWTASISFFSRDTGYSHGNTAFCESLHWYTLILDLAFRNLLIGILIFVSLSKFFITFNFNLVSSSIFLSFTLHRYEILMSFFNQGLLLLLHRSLFFFNLSCSLEWVLWWLSTV